MSVQSKQQLAMQTKRKQRGSAMHARDADDDLEEWKKSKQLAKPQDQVELSDAELKEFIGRNLVLTNPHIPDNIVEFSYMQGQFVPVPIISNYVVVYSARGSYIHRDTEEAKAQMIAQGIDPSMFGDYAQEEEETEMEAETVDEFVKDEETEDMGEEPPLSEGGEEAVAQEEKQEEAEETSSRPAPGKRLKNQFNFCERAALTFNLPARCQETQTSPPPSFNFSANVLQWIIYDSYQQDFAEQQLEAERERERKERDRAPVSKAMAKPTKAISKKQLSEVVQARVFECWKVLERMINQNTYDEIAKDFRYWEDPSDEYREEEGTLLPLWKYHYEKTKKHTVTLLSWNPWYYDLFIVCFGYLDFLKPIQEGVICLYTIKNPSYPESICETDSAVMCADVHPKYPYMLACGLFDGNIQVYNIQASTKKPAYVTKSYQDKHSAIVWSIQWVNDLPDGELNFYSVGNDGKVNNYVLMQNELSVTTMINLMLDREAVPGPDGTLVLMKACPTYILFHPKDPTIYLVGTEEGNIYKCSVNYSSQPLLTYKGHHMPVYKLDYNKYNSDIFISCSGDWRIKIWEDNRIDPLFVFDLGASIMDVAWAPYSSTVFGSVTTEGKVYIFDLNINKYKAICVQAVVSKKRNKLTTIAFNPQLPIIIVGDDKGTITALKLSPNLRIMCKAPKKQQHLDQWTLQCMKLDKLLAIVREPTVLHVTMEVQSVES